MNWPETDISSDLAMGALACMEGDPEPFLAAAFNAFWIENRNLDDGSVVESLLREAGAPSDAVDEAKFRAALEAAQSEAETAGVVDTPAFIVKDQIFVGREHFPWIRELLTAS